MLHTWPLSWQLYDWPNTCSPISITDSIYKVTTRHQYQRRAHVCLSGGVSLHWWTAVVYEEWFLLLVNNCCHCYSIVWLIYWIFMDYCKSAGYCLPDSGYYRISQILPDNPALPDIRYIPSGKEFHSSITSLLKKCFLTSSLGLSLGIG